MIDASRPCRQGGDDAIADRGSLMELPEHHSYTSMSYEGQAAVGRIAVWAAWLELSLEHFVAVLLKTDFSIAQVATKDMTASKLMTVARGLIGHESAEYSEEFRTRAIDLLGRCKTAFEQRNRVLHGATGGSLTPKAVSFRSRRTFPNSSISISHVILESDLDSISARLFGLTDEVFDLQFELEKERGASQ